jgi:hypothetical protein
MDVNKEICIICGKNKKGIPVKDDYVIKSLRWLKKVTNRYKGGKLVVCKECYPKYKGYRKKYTSRRMTYVAIGIIFAILIIILSRSVFSVISGILIILFLYLLSLLTYMPDLDIKKK